MTTATALQQLTTIAELRAWSRASHRAGFTVGLVPTMGALHAGHVSLVREARRYADRVVASIFVNPTQFGPNEDFSRYPRTFEADCQLLEAEGCDAVFCPSVEEMYPAGATSFVEVEDLSNRLDGASRPGHFRGVATIVSKLFLAAEADKAFFGQKDAAQVAVLRRMVRDLRFGVELIVCPILREPDGLAMSSRNIYLSATERQQALVLSRALSDVRQLYNDGERNAARLIAAAQARFASEPTARIDYITVVDWATLEPVEQATPGTLFAIAANIGKTRLIDNQVFA